MKTKRKIKTLTLHCLPVFLRKNNFTGWGVCVYVFNIEQELCWQYNGLSVINICSQSEELANLEMAFQITAGKSLASVDI